MAPKNITESQWMTELARILNRAGDEGMTAAEVAASIRKSIDYARRLLSRLQAAGRLGVGRRNTITLDGRATTCPVYWIKPEKKG